MKTSKKDWIWPSVLIVMLMGLFLSIAFLGEKAPQIEHKNPLSILPESIVKDGIVHQSKEFVLTKTNRHTAIDAGYRQILWEWGIVCSCGYIHPIDEYELTHMPIDSMICSCGYHHSLYLENGHLKVNENKSF
ncbi:MAG: hypothetical protein WC242_02380 [Candidatus Paceibacterota bacterium]|jgi:hypothetical protein